VPWVTRADGATFCRGIDHVFHDDTVPDFTRGLVASYPPCGQTYRAAAPMPIAARGKIPPQNTQTNLETR
jgi:hypothetical protein